MTGVQTCALPISLGSTTELQDDLKLAGDDEGVGSQLHLPQGKREETLDLHGRLRRRQAMAAAPPTTSRISWVMAA